MDPVVSQILTLPHPYLLEVSMQFRVSPRLRHGEQHRLAEPGGELGGDLLQQLVLVHEGGVVVGDPPDAKSRGNEFRQRIKAQHSSIVVHGQH